MELNREGLELIKRFEGLRLEAYRDVAGIWTIGYGHTKTARPGMKINAQEAEDLLRDDTRAARHAVQRLTKVSINDNEFSGLVSLVFNIGEGAFAHSTALRLLNKDNRSGAADAIELWNKATVDGKKQVLNGLVARRAAEKALFLRPVAAAAVIPPPPPEAEARPGKDEDGRAGGKPTQVKTPPDRGPESRVQPDEASRARRDRILQSRTLKGAAATLAGGASAVGTGATMDRTDLPQALQSFLTFVKAHPDELLMGVGALVVLASLLVVFARLDDWSQGRR